jgi:hypothetical protein
MQTQSFYQNKINTRPLSTKIFAEAKPQINRLDYPIIQNFGKLGDLRINQYEEFMNNINSQSTKEENPPNNQYNPQKQSVMNKLFNKWSFDDCFILLIILISITLFIKYKDCVFY